MFVFWQYPDLFGDWMDFCSWKMLHTSKCGVSLRKVHTIRTQELMIALFKNTLHIIGTLVGIKKIWLNCVIINCDHLITEGSYNNTQFPPTNNIGLCTISTGTSCVNFEWIERNRSDSCTQGQFTQGHFKSLAFMHTRQIIQSIPWTSSIAIPMLKIGRVGGWVGGSSDWLQLFMKKVKFF